MSEFGSLNSREVGSAGGVHGRAVVWVPGGLERSGSAMEDLSEVGEKGRLPELRSGGRSGD